VFCAVVVVTVEDSEGWRQLLHIQVAAVYCLMIGIVNLFSFFLQIRNLEARKNSLSMALETAKQKDKKDVIIETLFKLSEVETKLSQLRKSKTQVTEGNCCLNYSVKMRLALKETDCCHLLQFYHYILSPTVFRIYSCM